MVFEKLLDPVFNPLLSLHPFLAVSIVSLLVSVIITVIYKFTTNQNLMKSLKTEMKELQNEMKELRDHPEEMMKVQKKAMQSNMKYMGQSFKSTFYTFIPIILIFSWMNAHYAFEPILPEEQFQITLNFEKASMGAATITTPQGIEVIGDPMQEIINDKAVFTLKGKEGKYIEGNSLKLEYGDRIFFKDVLITNEQKYAKIEEPIKNSNLKSISINNKKKVILPILNWGWLGTYIILSIISSMTLRKTLKVY
ncbi:MAG: DUF106 domain-containing protein [Nanoarchaeota archaeon]|nr:DUF106 domain-containing protein [Nanoarchaeota archaeon]